MGTYLGLVLGHSQKNLCHSVSYVVLDYILHKKHSYKHTYSRVDQEQEIICFSGKPGCKMMMEVFNRSLQNHRRQTAGNADHKRQEHDNITLRHLHQQPSQRRQNILYEKPRPHSNSTIIQR